MPSAPYAERERGDAHAETNNRTGSVPGKTIVASASVGFDLDCRRIARGGNPCRPGNTAHGEGGLRIYGDPADLRVSAGQKIGNREGESEADRHSGFCRNLLSASAVGEWDVLRRGVPWLWSYACGASDWRNPWKLTSPEGQRSECA